MDFCELLLNAQPDLQVTKFFNLCYGEINSCYAHGITLKNNVNLLK